MTERVLRETDRPVLTVTPRLFPPTNVKLQTILCPVNFTEVARAALEQACAMAEAFDAGLFVVHVVEGDAARLGNAEVQFSAWVDPLIQTRTRYQQLTVHGDAAARVLEVANQTAADLIVIGAQHKRFSDATVIGTTTERITRFAKRLVLTVIRPAAEKLERSREEVEVLA